MHIKISSEATTKKKCQNEHRKQFSFIPRLKDRMFSKLNIDNSFYLIHQ